MIILVGERQKNRGFLLLEVMISVAILSIGTLLILNSFMRPLRAIEFSRDCFKAGLLLEEKMLELYNSDIKDGLSKGVFSNFDNKFSWNLGVIKLEEDACNEVNLRILWQGKDREENLSASTYII
jgi:prepilin-type N-terminal cleavage/methylation domain-containing protein